MYLGNENRYLVIPNNYTRRLPNREAYIMRLEEIRKNVEVQKKAEGTEREKERGFNLGVATDKAKGNHVL